MHKKPFLPEKTCPVCGRPFAWRKKWRNNWDTVANSIPKLLHTADKVLDELTRGAGSR